MRKDKEKVLDEVWTEDHVKSFLQVRPHDGSDENFYMLLKAYKSMRASGLMRQLTGPPALTLARQSPSWRTRDAI